MDLITALLGEHGVLYAQLAQLEATLPAAECPGKVRTPLATLAAALESHARLEDELLFPALEARLGSGPGPVAVMRAEHEVIEAGLAKLQQLEEVDEARRQALALLALTRQHFVKEERVLFPLARQLLDPQTLAALAERWAAARGVPAGLAARAA